MKRSFLIKKNKQYRIIYNKGISLANRYAVVFACKNGLNKRRYGFSVSKKIGKANKRNKVKRKMREICRLNGNCLINGYDYVFIARKGIEELDFSSILNIMENLAYRINKKTAREN